MTLISHIPKTRENRDDSLIRLRDPVARSYLHLSGSGTTKDINYSWLGSRAQAKRLQAQAERRGQDWPFCKVHR
ncbi:hypothetical protein [uncultured Pelagimonas sp.]|uniref:hypothetical protein n=1 Tax=uncultured Pelagimonas sp. TaxID=1618102 RepID=UPI00260C8947|nr:hypothetical protein [uncultured Pelagimonas sp.]